MNRSLIASAALALSFGPALCAQTGHPVMTEVPSPLDLKGAIGYALDHNFTILQARETIRLRERVIVQVRGQEIPNISAAGQYQRNEPSISQVFPPTDSLWTVELKATQNLFAGGGIQSSNKNAKLSRDAAGYDLQTAIDAALLDVRTQFYSVILAREKIRVEEEE